MIRGLNLLGTNRTLSGLSPDTFTYFIHFLMFILLCFYAI